MEYILIVYMHAYARTALEMQEFNTLDACLTASVVIERRVKTKNLSLDCVEKGKKAK
jgi:hypothetical protein